MGAKTGIQWCHHTWSPWRGCAKVSTGCKFCYAESLSRRNPAVLGEWGPDGARVVNADWDAPRRWGRAAAKSGEEVRVFPSMCDPFEDRPDLVDPRIRFLELIFATPNLTWLLLTKRIEWFRASLLGAMVRIKDRFGRRTPLYWDVAGWLHGTSVPANVWLGVSVEDQEHAEKRIPILLETPAAVRWVSYEPALGPVDFTPWLDEAFTCTADPDDPGATVRALDWIVVGGESGARDKVRWFDVAWARSTVADCKAAGVPVFVKQLGTNPYELGIALKHLPGHEDGERYFQPHRHALALEHPKGGDMAEWPEYLRVREFPNEAPAARGGAR